MICIPKAADAAVDDAIAVEYSGDQVEMMTATATAVEKTIRYIIKIATDLVGGAITNLFNSDGEELEDAGHGSDYKVAKEDETVLLEITASDGYCLTGAFNGLDEIAPLHFSDGHYYIEMPKGGGVYLTAEFEKIKQEVQGEQGEQGEQGSSEDRQETNTRNETKQETTREEAPIKAVTQVAVKIVTLKVEGGVIEFYSNGFFVIKFNDLRIENGKFMFDGEQLKLIKADQSEILVSTDGSFEYASSQDPNTILKFKLSVNDITKLKNK